MSMLKRLSIGAFLAVVLAVVLRILLPLPVVTVFAALFFFFVLQLIEQNFGGGLHIATSWLKMAVRAAVALIAFVALRFLIGQVFSLYPIDAKGSWWNGGGFDGMFWGREASRHITLEIVIIGLLSGIMWGCLRQSRWAKLAAFALVVVIVAGVIFPRWSKSWPAKKDRVDQSLDQNGLVKTVQAAMGTPTSADLTNYSNNIVCEDAWQHEAAGVNNHLNQLDIPYFDVALRPCGDAWVYLPSLPAWQRFNKEFVGGDASLCRASIQFYGGDPTPTFGQNNIPIFNNAPRKFRVRGPEGCTLRYFLDG